MLKSRGYKDAKDYQYIDWLVGYLANGGELTTKNLTDESSLVDIIKIAKTDELYIPELFGVNSVICIVPEDTIVKNKKLGDNVLFCMKNFKVESNKPCVPINSGVILSLKKRKEFKKEDLTFLSNASYQIHHDDKLGAKKNLLSFHASIAGKLNTEEYLNKYKEFLEKERSNRLGLITERITDNNKKMLDCGYKSNQLTDDWNKVCGEAAVEINEIEIKLAALSKDKKPKGAQPN